MKNVLLHSKLLIAILLFIPILVNGQVLISNTLDESVFFGPDNIIGDKAYLSSDYMEDLKIAYSDLTYLYQEENSRQIAIESLEKIKKRDKIALSDIKQSKSQISLELSMIDSLINQWAKISLKQDQLSEAKKSLEDGNCIEFSTTEGVFYSEDITIRGINDVYYEQVILPTKINKETKWTKIKADANCLSDEPEDCMVWCLKEINYYFYNDMKNDKYDGEACPCDMNYDENLKYCSKKIEYNQNRTRINRLRLLSAGELRSLELIDWKVVNCE